MTHLPTVNFKTVERVLLRLDFQIVRQKGSRVFYCHPDGRMTTGGDSDHFPLRGVATAASEQAALGKLLGQLAAVDRSISSAVV